MWSAKCNRTQTCRKWFHIPIWFCSLQRLFAHDTARQCIEDALSLQGRDVQHARYFAAAEYTVLREALPLTAEGSPLKLVWNPHLISVSYATNTGIANYHYETVAGSGRLNVIVILPITCHAWLLTLIVDIAGSAMLTAASTGALPSLEQNFDTLETTELKTVGRGMQMRHERSATI